MSRVVKNVVVVFTVLCVIVLSIFCVELYVQNRGPGNGRGEGESMSGSSSGGTENDPDVSQLDPDKDPSDGAGKPSDTGRESGTPQPSPLGRRYEIGMPDEMTLVLYVDDELFEHIEMDLRDMYEFKGTGTASLQIVLEFLSAGADALAIDYLDGYVGRGRTSVGEEGQIRHSSLDGIFMSGEKDGEIYEAWIHSFSTGGNENWGVAFVLHYRDNIQKNALYEILDTLSMITG